MNHHYHRGRILFGLCRYAEAERELRAALEDGPQDNHSHRVRALCLHNLGRDKEGRIAADTALGLDPENWLNHYALSACLVGLISATDWPACAERALKSTLRLAPGDADTWGLLAFLRWRERRWLDMLQAAQEGLRHDPRHLSCFIYQAEAYSELGNLIAAESSTREALALEPDSARGHSMLGRILLGKGQREAAERCFLEALRNNPQEHSAQHGLKLKRSWFRRQFEEETSILNTVNFDPSARQPASVANITCLIQELRDEKPKLRFRLLHGLLAMWLRWPMAIRPGGPDDITAFIRFFFQALLFVGGLLLLGTALGMIFLLFGPSTPLGPKVGSYWALGIIVLFLGFLLSVINVSWLTKRWIEQRVAQSKWKTQPLILK